MNIKDLCTITHDTTLLKTGISTIVCQQLDKCCFSYGINVNNAVDSYVQLKTSKYDASLDDYILYTFKVYNDGAISLRAADSDDRLISIRRIIANDDEYYYEQTYSDMLLELSQAGRDKASIVKELVDTLVNIFTADSADDIKYICDRLTFRYTLPTVDKLTLHPIDLWLLEDIGYTTVRKDCISAVKTTETDLINELKYATDTFTNDGSDQASLTPIGYDINNMCTITVGNKKLEVDFDTASADIIINALTELKEIR